MACHDRTGSRPRQGEQGFTLVEVMVATVIAVVGVLGGALAIMTGANLQQETREYGRAFQASRDVVEQLRSGDLATGYADFLGRRPYEVGGVRVDVQFPEQVLRDFAGQVPSGARFRDRDGDGEVDVDPTATELASLLPLVVTVQWGPGGVMRAPYVVVNR